MGYSLTIQQHGCFTKGVIKELDCVAYFGIVLLVLFGVLKVEDLLHYFKTH